MKRNDFGNYCSQETLRDRRQVTIRAIRPDDKGSLIDALNKVSSQSLYFRLFSGKRNFSDEEMNQLTKIDFVNVVPLVAVLEKDGNERIVGGGRYVRVGTSGTGQSAEVAFSSMTPTRDSASGRAFSSIWWRSPASRESPVSKPRFCPRTRPC
jgi:hypothetical protein